MEPVHVVLLVVGSQVVLYAARRPVHALLRTLGTAISGIFRLAARVCAGRAGAVREACDHTLVEEAREDAQRRLDHEVALAESIIPDALARYSRGEQALDLQLGEIQESLGKARDAIPESSKDALDAVLAARSDPGGSDEELGQLMSSLSAASQAKVAHARVWSELHAQADSMTVAVSALEGHVARVRDYAKGVAELEEPTPALVKRLRRYNVIRFVGGAALLSLCAGGVAIHYALIADTMALVLPRAGTLAPLALMVLSIVGGFCFAEGVGLTHVLPASWRSRRLGWAGVLSLTALSLSQWGLALSQGRISAAVLAFVLPWIFAMAVVPAQLVGSSGTVALAEAQRLAYGVVGHTSRLLAHLIRFAFRALQHTYDVYVAVPLRVERFFVKEPVEPRDIPSLAINLIEPVAEEISQTQPSHTDE